MNEWMLNVGGGFGGGDGGGGCGIFGGCVLSVVAVVVSKFSLMNLLKFDSSAFPQ